MGTGSGPVVDVSSSNTVADIAININSHVLKVIWMARNMRITSPKVFDVSNRPSAGANRAAVVGHHPRYETACMHRMTAIGIVSWSS